MWFSPFKRLQVINKERERLIQCKFILENTLSESFFSKIQKEISSNKNLKQDIKLLDKVYKEHLWFSSLFSFSINLDTKKLSTSDENDEDFLSKIWLFFYTPSNENISDDYIYLFALWYRDMNLFSYKINTTRENNALLNGLAIKKDEKIKSLLDVFSKIGLDANSKFNISKNIQSSNNKYINIYKDNIKINLSNIDWIPFVWLFNENEEQNWNMIFKNDYIDKPITLKEYINTFCTNDSVNNQNYHYNATQKENLFVDKMEAVVNYSWTYLYNLMMLKNKRYMTFVDNFVKNKVFITIDFEKYNINIEKIIKIIIQKWCYNIYFIDELYKEQNNKKIFIKCLKINTSTFEDKQIEVFDTKKPYKKNDYSLNLEKNIIIDYYSDSLLSKNEFWKKIYQDIYQTKLLKIANQALSLYENMNNNQFPYWIHIFHIIDNIFLSSKPLIFFLYQWKDTHNSQLAITLNKGFHSWFCSNNQFNIETLSWHLNLSYKDIWNFDQYPVSLYILWYKNQKTYNHKSIFPLFTQTQIEKDNYYWLLNMKGKNTFLQKILK